MVSRQNFCLLTIFACHILTCQKVQIINREISSNRQHQGAFRWYDKYISAEPLTIPPGCEATANLLGTNRARFVFNK